MGAVGEGQTANILPSCCMKCHFSQQSLDLTTRRMIHEGPLTWRISKDKTLGVCQEGVCEGNPARASPLWNSVL